MRGVNLQSSCDPWRRIRAWASIVTYYLPWCLLFLGKWCTISKGLNKALAWCRIQDPPYVCLVICVCFVLLILLYWNCPVHRGRAFSDFLNHTAFPGPRFVLLFIHWSIHKTASKLICLLPPQCHYHLKSSSKRLTCFVTNITKFVYNFHQPVAMI